MKKFFKVSIPVRDNSAATQATAQTGHFLSLLWIFKYKILTAKPEIDAVTLLATTVWKLLWNFLITFSEKCFRDFISSWYSWDYWLIGYYYSDSPFGDNATHRISRKNSFWFGLSFCSPWNICLCDYLRNPEGTCSWIPFLELLLFFYILLRAYLLFFGHTLMKIIYYNAIHNYIFVIKYVLVFLCFFLFSLTC